MMNNTTPQKTDGPASAGSFFDIIAFAARSLAGLFMIMLVLLVASEIVSRFFFNYSLRVVEELVGYLVVGLTLLGASLALRSNRLFQVGFVFQSLSRPLQRALSLFYMAISLGVCSVLIWQTAQLVLSSLNRGNVAPTILMTPLWLPQLLVPLGLLFIAVFIVEHAVLTLRSGGSH